MKTRTFLAAVAAATLAGGTAVLAQQGASDNKVPMQRGQMPMMQGQGQGEGMMGQGQGMMGQGMQMRHGMHGGDGGMHGRMGGMHHGKGKKHGPTLRIAIESEDRTLHFECNAEMDDCLKALAQVQGTGQ